jgi:DNA (cytosine-5)-methyltransferase 1
MIRHVELFAGIGGFRSAIDLYGKDFKQKTDCIAYSEIDQYAIETYKSNFDTRREVAMGDIVHFTSKDENIESLPDFDLLTGGFPCQSFSMMGKKRGFSDIRGNVFFRIIDILKIKQPAFVLLENVRNLRTHDHGNTFKTIIDSIYRCGYPYVYSDVINSEHFGLAQTRNRVYIFASRYKLSDKFVFNAKAIERDFNSIDKTSLLKQQNVLDVLAKKVDDKYYLSEVLKPTILSDGSKKFSSKSEINRLIARPLTATMVKMHRACQDNYYSNEFINARDPIKYSQKEFTKSELANHHIRKITPEEAFALQGFSKKFFLNAVNAGVSNHQLYKQAGNAVSVNTVYAIMHYLFTTKKIMKYVF